MKKQISENVKKLQIALVGLIVVVILLFIIGWIVYKPEPTIIQGTAEVDEVRVSGKIPGRIVKLYATEGQQVLKGDTLVVIESPEIMAKLQQANAAEKMALSQDKKAKKGARKEQIAGAYEMWQKAKIGVDITLKSFDRVQRLYDKGVVSAQKRDEVEAKYLAAKATEAAAKSQYQMAFNGATTEDKQAAKALVAKAQGAVNEVKAYLSETILTAPIDGEISEIFPKQGELVGTGAPIMNVVDLDKIWVVFNVKEDQLGELKMGRKIKASIPALKKTSVELKITYLKALASYATWKAIRTTDEFDVKTFEVRAVPLRKVPDLRPGMSILIEK